MAKLGYPSLAQREKAFAPVRKRAGDDAYASRYRALSFAYAGRPADALRMYLDAFARADVEQVGRAGQDLIVAGARAVRGHVAGLEAFYDYVSHGPAGPDGRAGTSDDLDNPFLKLGLTAADLAPRTPGGAADLTGDDVKALRDARKLLIDLAVSPIERSDTHVYALNGWVRIQQALCEWQGQPKPDWFVERLLENSRDGRLSAAWLQAGLLAARGGQCHLGGDRAFWRKLDEAAARAGKTLHRDLDRRRSGFQKMLAAFDDPRPPLPRGLKLMNPPRRR